MNFLSRWFSASAIAIDGHAAKAVKGKATRALLSEISSLSRELEIERGEIWIDALGRSTFSAEIPESSHQRFRNLMVGNFD